MSCWLDQGQAGFLQSRTDRVYVMDWDVLNGLDQVVGITYLAKLLHPEVDLDPVSVHKEYLTAPGTGISRRKDLRLPGA